jgi:hypothetical protein
MKLKSILTAAALASPLLVCSIAFAADAASTPAAARPNASAAAHSAAKKKLAQCKADAAAQKPALDAQATKLFLHTCVTKAE